MVRDGRMDKLLKEAVNVLMPLFLEIPGGIGRQGALDAGETGRPGKGKRGRARVFRTVAAAASVTGDRSADVRPSARARTGGA
jgi:hypothetical protein